MFIVLRKLIWRLLLIFIFAIIVITVGIMGFVRYAPQFGAPPSGKHLEKIARSTNYKEGQFQNQITTIMDLGLKGGAKVMYEWFADGGSRTPTKPLPTGFGQEVAEGGLHITWFGHSAVLLEIDGMTVLFDPMLSDAAAPVSFFAQRFDYQQAIVLDSIPYVDAVILSHDHYDHLDYQSILALKDRVKHFYTALGVGSHLMKWGVDSTRITELDWWESTNHEHLKLVAAPSRHFSGRAITDRNKTQWASWIVLGKQERVYFSGDSGYGPHFQQIGEQYGPFDFAMMECGQYHERWEAIHMMPEQTVLAAQDVKAKNMMPIHWGAFRLALHSWTDPVERASEAAKGTEIQLLTPIIGKKFSFSAADQNQKQWWRDL
jgi:L-ascorbate metabolism protein UlaG (beta-lactamase superfamily)